MVEINFDRLRIHTMEYANTLAKTLDKLLVSPDKLSTLEREFYTEQAIEEMNHLLSNVFTIASCNGENETVNNVQGDFIPYFLEIRHELDD